MVIASLLEASEKRKNGVSNTGTLFPLTTRFDG